MFAEFHCRHVSNRKCRSGWNVRRMLQATSLTHCFRIRPDQQEDLALHRFQGSPLSLPANACRLFRPSLVFLHVPESSLLSVLAVSTDRCLSFGPRLGSWPRVPSCRAAFS
jgi:hypothetical protein